MSRFARKLIITKLVELNVLILKILLLFLHHLLHLVVLLLLLLHLLLLVQDESLLLLISHLLELFALTRQQEDLLALHFALLCDHLSLNVNREALDRTFHRISLLHQVRIILHLLGLFHNIFITLLALSNLWLEFAFFLAFFLFFVPLVSYPIVDLVTPY